MFWLVDVSGTLFTVVAGFWFSFVVCYVVAGFWWLVVFGGCLWVWCCFGALFAYGVVLPG